jgi:hypothetical protein
METVNYGCNKFYDTGPKEAKYARVLVPEKPLILVFKVSNLPRREALERLNYRYQTRLGRFSYYKFTSLFSHFVSNEEKKFSNHGYRCECHKTFFFVVDPLAK